MGRLPIRALATGSLSTLAAFALAACGSSGAGTHSSGATTGGHRGGTLTMLTNEDVQGLDPGMAYGALQLTLLSATQRTLYAYRPTDPQHIAPDLAAGPPRIAADGKTLTVTLRRGVRFSPPVNREVTSRDVAYAIERGFNPNVANPYAPGYYGDIVGAEKAKGGPIAGIQTPDDHTIVFKLTKPTASLLAQAMILPLDAPVPSEYARSFDAHAPSDYGNYQVGTGPYMLAADAHGKVLGTGYQPGRRIHLVRNPNWKASSDDRPAYLDDVVWTIGGAPTVSSRQVLQGSDMVFGDAPPAAIVKLASQRYSKQITFSPGAGSRYIALNTQIPPFDDANLRKAVAAALDRNQMRLVRGGASIGDVPTHFIYPGVLGFEQAGGQRGFGDDFLASPSGDLTLARRYLKAAGYPSGRYTGGGTIQVIGLAGAPDDADAQIVDQTLRNLGFKTSLKVVDASVMYSRFCALPKAKVQVCTNLGWVRDFADPQTVLDAAFNGAAIAPENNSNWPQLNDPKINAAMAAAESVVGEQQRAQAWANVDRMVTATAAAIPWLWDRQPLITSRDVHCVRELWDQGNCDFAYSSVG
jgi:peptide/nickel transport system substrate-binding protein